MSNISNKEVTDILREVADMYRMKDVEFKPQAYANAADGVDAIQKPIAEIYNSKGISGLQKIDGIGESIAKHIGSLIEDGSFDEYESLREEIPVNVAEMTALEGVGPKTVSKLYDQLGITNLDELEKAAEAEKVRKIDGFGVATENNILEAITFYRQHSGRFLLSDAMTAAEDIKEELADISAVERVAVAGSTRRWQATVGDLDILVVADNSAEVTRAFCDRSVVESVHTRGNTRASVRLDNQMDVDLRVVEESSWGAALNYFTGAKQHNVALRKLAQKCEWKLNEYGLFDRSDIDADEVAEETAGKRIAAENERDIYNALDLSYIPPELRENDGEIEAAKKDFEGGEGDLPDLIEHGDLRGDLQMHTTASDGNASAHEMAQAASERGHEYIAITDHTQALAMAGGLNESELTKQIQQIKDLNERLGQEGDDITVLAGSEVDILKDGSLDIADEVLSELDIVGAAVHSHFSLPEEKQTKRVLKAINHPEVDIIFHLTGRRLMKRAGIELGIDTIIEAVKETETILEIDASPERLDIEGAIVRRCVDAGVKMSIDSDAHAPQHLDYLKYGVGQARRGWASKDDIVNTWSLQKLQSYICN